MSFAMRVDHWEDIPKVISQMHAAGCGFRVPPFQALYAGRIAYLEATPETSAGVLKRWFAASKLPSLALLGDDAYRERSGPDAWATAERALRWSRAIVVHGGGGETSHYHAAVEMTVEHRRAVFVECASVDVVAWLAAADRWAPRGPRLIIVPPGGGIHPCHVGPAH